ncbi:hypothetical protein [Jannaschia sp. 2305UL9-9]|uniref:hypothetical protein n=1 Tax=Jannaschia sp. 2305UL9-9 TaxID=3121638 RepID=UPI003527809B
MAQANDIEDVLSSIRRLVANEAKPAAEAAALSEAPAKPAPALVLAPTQRVTDPEDPFQMIRTLAQAERDARDAEHVVDVVEAEVASISRDIVAEEATQVSDWTADEAGPDPVTDLLNDYVEDDDYQAEPAEADPAETAAYMDMAEQAAPLDADTEVEAAVDTLAAENVTPLSTHPTFADEDDDDDTDVDLADISDAVTTDDALRDLIAEIVRQELSGALGERITRNVRKLVRREIRQMLSSGEFD